MARKQTSKGITDWDNKLKALRFLFGEEQDRRLVMQILGRDPNDKASDDKTVGSIADMLPKWHTSNPTGSVGKILTDAIVKQWMALGSSAHEAAIRQAFIHENCAQLMALLPPEKTKGLPTFGTKRPHSELIPLWVIPRRPHHDENADPLNPDTEFDQKYLYDSPAAARVWERMALGGAYSVYTQCQESLQRLVQRPAWRAALESGHFGGLVILGAGAPHKERVLLNSLCQLVPASVGDPLCSLVDFNKPMLDVSIHQLFPDLKADQLWANRGLQIVPFGIDFNDMNRVNRGGLIRLRTEKNVVWVIPGATYGNLDLQKFMTSLRNEALPGDWLVIGTPTVLENGITEQEKKAIRNAFLSGQVSDLLKNTLTTAWLHWHRNINEATFQEILNSIHVDISANDNPVPGTWDIDISIKINETDHFIAKSRRFELQAWSEWMKKYGFEYQFDIDVLESTYKQVVFELKAS